MLPGHNATLPARFRPTPATTRSVLAGVFVSGLALLLATFAAVAPAAAQGSGLAFNAASSQYVTFGTATSLGAAQFTIELWFKRTGTGVTVSTGTGGVTAIPLLTKGRGEAEGSNVDMAWFLGIRGTDSLLVADFEEGPGGPGPLGQNHPVVGVTPIRSNRWYHAAATYDGRTWRLYLNGNLETALDLGANCPPRYDSIQHAGIGTAMTSTGVPAGYFTGLVDEARVWSVARSQADLRADLLREVTSGTGLLGRWGLNEGSGNTAANSVPGGPAGTLTGGPAWGVGSPFGFGLDFGGSNAYVTFGAAPSLDAATFTIEAWVRKDGAGVTASTGTGGVTAVPLVTKGRGEAEGSNVDMNWFLGLDATGHLVADFEEGAGGPGPLGQNHPVTGTAVVATGTWTHVAATYDGRVWRLYVNGTLDQTLDLGSSIPPRFDSIQHAALGSALTSTGAAAGYLDGMLDEVRVWNVARSQAEIQSTINARLESATSGLIGRWALDEGLGTAVAGSAGTAVNGTVTGSAFAWDGGAPFNATFGPPQAPAAPTGVTANAIAWNRVQVTWTDASTDETGFIVERSTAGAGGPYVAIDSTVANTGSYDDLGRAASTQYCYRVRAWNGAGVSDVTGSPCVTTPAPAATALDFGGTNAYVDFGDAPALNAATFTIECWFRRDGAGTTTTTGTGGVTDAIPLVTKGRGEVDNADNKDTNWFLGIRASDGVLFADFEEGAAGPSPSLNHPVIGVTPVGTGTWHHGAAAYDGRVWRLYLDGVLEATVDLGAAIPPRFDSIQHAAIGSALTSAGVAEGFFDGVLDEVRVWNVARSEAEIQADINAQLAAPQAGLAGRWGLDEGAGTIVQSTAATAVTGSVLGAAWAWTGGAPFDIVIGPPTPPAAPAYLAATSTTSNAVDLTWSDLSGNETRFEIERSTTGPAGTYTFRAQVAANVTSWTDTGLDPATPYCYRIRAANGAGASAYDGPACATTTAAPNCALHFTASGSYVTFGNAAALGLPVFTVECWFRRDGAGTTANTGSGGVNAIPLVTKGVGEADGTTQDMNWFLGLRGTDYVLIADFEEGAAGASPGLNHPAIGVTPVAVGVWHHAAATYDGTTWRLYLDGTLEAQVAVGQPPRFDSIQHAGLGVALNSTGVASGWFDGAIDEARVWNVARTQGEVVALMNSPLTAPTAGLVARWGLDECSGTAVNGSAGTAVNGTVTGANAAWIPGAPFNAHANLPPATPLLVSPADGASAVARPPSLAVAVSDPDGDPVTVRWYGRPVSQTAGPDFTLIQIPDTQNYTNEASGGSNAMFKSQAAWVVAQRAARNIAYVVHVGDISESGQNGGNPIQWVRADSAMALLENPVTTGLPQGIPFGMQVGNHDQTPNGDPDAAGGTAFYNQYFGTARFAGRDYYGGGYRGSSDNHFDLFSAGGLDFLVVYLEYDTSPDAAVLDWADSLLVAYPGRRAIAVTHAAVNTGNPGSFTTQGQAIYDRLKLRPNYFMMLGGHAPGEGRRQDSYAGRTVHSLLADYQSRTNGGSGWLRILEFSPANNVIRVRTYTPWLNQFEADADSSSQFTLPYDMAGGGGFVLLGTQSNVPSGTTATLPWAGLLPNQPYEWYAVVDDGTAQVTGPTWSFTTASDPPTAQVVAPNGGEELTAGASATLQWTAADDAGVTGVDLYLSRAGEGGPWETLATGLPNTGVFTWTVTGPATTDARLRVVAHDAQGQSAEDVSDASFRILDLVAVEGAGVTEFALDPVAPNPMAGRARVSYALPATARVRIAVYDPAGREVARLVDRVHEPGRYDVAWDGTGPRGRIGAGLYFVRFEAAGHVKVRRVAILD